MRFLKRLLAGIYIYLAAFAVICFAAWLIRGDEPAALIAGVFGAAGTESIVGALIRIREIRSEKEQEKQDTPDQFPPRAE